MREETDLKYKYLGMNLAALLICVIVNILGALLKATIFGG